MTPKFRTGRKNKNVILTYDGASSVCICYVQKEYEHLTGKILKFLNNMEETKQVPELTEEEIHDYFCNDLGAIVKRQIISQEKSRSDEYWKLELDRKINQLSISYEEDLSNVIVAGNSKLKEQAERIAELERKLEEKANESDDLKYASLSHSDKMYKCGYEDGTNEVKNNFAKYF